MTTYCPCVRVALQMAMVMILLMLLPCSSAYKCINDVVSISPAIAVGEPITIENCIFQNHLRFENPGVVRIGGDHNIIRAGISILGVDTSTPRDGAPISMENVEVVGTVIFQSMLLTAVDQSITISNCTMNRLTLLDVTLSNAQVQVHSSTIKNLGVRFFTVHVSGPTSRIHFIDTHIESSLSDYGSSGSAFLLESPVFDNQSQLIFQNTILKATRDVVNLDTKKNRTLSVYNWNMFRNGALMNFTNTIVASATRHSLRSFNYDSTKHYGTFTSGSKLIATNSSFRGGVELYLMEGATAMLDAVSYEAVDLTIHGDNEEQVVIPVPHTISVKRLSLSNCRVHLPDLNIPTPLQNTWDVRVTHQFKVHDMRLTNGQHLLLQPGPVMNSAGAAVMLTKTNTTAGSSIKLLGLPISTTYFQGSFNDTTILVEDCRGTSTLTFQSSLFGESTTVTVRNSSATETAFASSALESKVAILLDNVTTDHLRFTTVSLDSTSTLTGDQLIVPKKGLHLNKLEANATTVKFVNSHIESTLSSGASNAAVYMSDAIFDNGAQLIFEDTVLRAKYDVINMWAATNRSLNEYFFSMFRRKAAMAFKNCMLISSSGYALRSKSYSNSRYRYGQFASGSMLKAINTSFSGEVELFLLEGATAEIDAVSLHDIRLSVQGDSEEHIVIPIPHSIQVKSLRLHGCRVFLPDLNKEHPSVVNVWDVQATNVFHVGRFRLDNNQQLLLRGREGESARGLLVTIENAFLAKGSRIVLSSVKMIALAIGGSFSEQSSVEVLDSSVSQATVFSNAQLSGSSRISISNSSLHSCMIQNSLITESSQIVFNHTKVADGLSFYEHTVLRENSSLLIHHSNLKTTTRTVVALRFQGSLFSNSLVCVHESEVIASRYGVALNFLHGPRSTRAHMFMNNTRLIFSDVFVGSGGGSQFVVMGNSLDTKKRSSWGIIGDTTIVMRNTTIDSGGCSLYLHANKTRVIVDSSTLSQSNLEFIGGVDDEQVATTTADWLDGVQYILPAKFATKALKLSGGTVRFSKSSVLDDIDDAKVAFVEVHKRLDWRQPLNLSLDAERQLHLFSGAESTRQRVILEPFSISNSSLLVLRDFPNAEFLRVSEAIVRSNSSILFQNIQSAYVTESIIVSNLQIVEGARVEIDNVTSAALPTTGRAPLTMSAVRCKDQDSHVRLHNVTSVTGVRLHSCAFSANARLHLVDCNISATNFDPAVLTFDMTTFGDGSFFTLHNSTLGSSSSPHWRDDLEPSARSVVFQTRNTFQRGSAAFMSNLVLHTVPNMAAKMPIIDMLPWPADPAEITCKSSRFMSTVVFHDLHVVEPPGGTTTTKATIRVVLSNGTIVFSSDKSNLLPLALSVSGADQSQIGCAAGTQQLCTEASLNGDVQRLDAPKVAETLSRMLHQAHQSTATTFTVPHEGSGSYIDARPFDTAVKTLASCLLPSYSPPPPGAMPSTRTASSTLHPHHPTRTTSRLLPQPPPSTVSAPTQNPPSATQTHTIGTSLSSSPTPDVETNVPTASISFSTPIPTNVTEAPPQPPETPPPTSPEPPTATNEPRVKLTTILGGGETEARVVTSTAGATSMVGASLGSGTGGVVAAISAVKLASCGLAADGTRPEYFELPIQFPIGSSHFRWYVGAVVAHAAMNAAVFVVLVWLRRVSGQEPRRRKRHQLKRVVRVLSMVFTGLHTFFTPNIVGGCATVMVHDSTATGRVVGAAALLLTTVVCGAVSTAIHGALRNGVATADEGGGGGGSKKGFSVVKRKFVASGHSTITSSSSSSRTTTTTSSSSDSEDELGSNDSFGSNTSSSSSDSDQDRRQEKSSSSGSSESRESQRLEREAARRKWLFSGPATIGTLLPLFEGCREFDRVLQRNYTTVEVGIASMIAAIAGARPNERCEYAAYATCAIAFAGIVYAVGVRPYRTYLDTAFSVANYLALVVLCVAVAVLSSSSSSSNEDGSSSKRERSEQAMAWSLWVISSGAYLHLVIQVVWGMYVQQRRQGRLEKAEEDAAAENTKPLLHDPRDGEVELQQLVVPEAATAANKTYSFTLPDDASLSDSFASVPDTMPKFENGDAVSGDEAVLNDSITVNPLSN